MEAPERPPSASSWLALGESEISRVGAPPGLGSPGMAPAGRPPPPPIPEEFAEEQAPSTGAAPSRAPRPAPPPVPSAAAAARWLNDPEGADADEATEELPEAAPRGRAARQLFEPYLDEDAVRRGLEDGSLIRGIIRVSLTKLGTAWVQPDGAKQRENDFLVKGKSARNRACNGDVVIIRRLAPGEMEAPHGRDRRRQGRGGRRGSDDNEQAEEAEEEEEEDDEDDDDDEVDEDDDVDADDEEQGASGTIGAFRAARLAAENAAETDSDEEDVVLGKALVKAPVKAKAPAASRSSARGSGKNGGDDRQYAKVVAIADPKGSTRVIVCTLHPNEKSGRERGDAIVRDTDTLLKAKPTDKRMPWILLQINDVTRKALQVPGRLDPFRLWPIQMIGWKETSTLPLGRLKGQCLGKAGDLDAEERHALMESELDCHDVDFDDAILDEVDNIVVEATRTFEDEVKKRLDLRKKRIFTIDPATARDLDDAIHVDLDEERKEVEIGVHIADVGHFVKLDSLADREAQFRTTSVYLINRVLPMLPHALCNHLCSLNPNEPKLAFSAFFRLKLETGELIEDPKPWFKKTAINSVCRLNYDEVQQVLDGKQIEPPPVYSGYAWKDIKDDIFLLYDVCGKVRRGRFEGGALSISKQKMIFHTRDSEDGIPTNYHLESHSASHWIIEELMLLANRCVAKHLAHARLSDSSVLRKHESPDPKKAEKMTQMMQENLGLEWDAFNAGAIYKSCQAIYRKYGEMLGLCVEMMTMRAGMKQAEYFVYNDEADPHHFALDFDYYTHFTSPIRRYPDVMVHRILCALLTLEDEGFQVGDKAEIQVAQCNEKKRATRKCSEQLDRAVFCIYLRAMKKWFYTVGTVLGFQQDHNSDEDKGMVTVYCSQLGRESKAVLCAGKAGLKELGLFEDGVNDMLMLPDSWRFCSKGMVELEWVPPDGDVTRRKRQPLKMLSCVPIVIIPTQSVPIDYALFFVSPFHPMHDGVAKEVPTMAKEGFDWVEVEEEGVEILHDARAAEADGGAAQD